jgi:hypothetical protein
VPLGERHLRLVVKDFVEHYKIPAVSKDFFHGLHEELPLAV